MGRRGLARRGRYGAWGGWGGVFLGLRQLLVVVVVVRGGMVGEVGVFGSEV